MGISNCGPPGVMPLFPLDEQIMNASHTLNHERIVPPCQIAAPAILSSLVNMHGHYLKSLFFNEVKHSDKDKKTCQFRQLANQMTMWRISNLTYFVDDLPQIK